MDNYLFFGVLSFTFFSSSILVSTRPKKLLEKITLTTLYSIHGVLSVFGIFFLNLYLSGRTGSNLIEMLKGGILISFILAIFSGGLGLTSIVLKYFNKVRQLRDKWVKRTISLWIHRLSVVGYTLLFLDLSILFSRQRNYLTMLLAQLIYLGVLVAFIYYQGPKKRNYRYKIKENNLLANNLSEVTIEPVKKLLTMDANQFVFLKVLDPTTSSESHPFSVVSDPYSEQLEFVIKCSGDFTKKTKEWQIGSHVLIEGPYTNFPNLKIVSDDILMIAGGIGITALISVLQNILSEGNHQHIMLLWSVAYKKELFYQLELEKLAERYSNFSYELFVTRETIGGFLNERVSKNIIEKHFKARSYNETEVIISANASMTKALKKELESLDFDKKKIHSNSFMF